MDVTGDAVYCGLLQRILGVQDPSASLLSSSQIDQVLNHVLEKVDQGIIKFYTDRYDSIIGESQRKLFLLAICRVSPEHLPFVTQLSDPDFVKFLLLNRLAYSVKQSLQLLQSTEHNILVHMLAAVLAEDHLCLPMYGELFDAETAQVLEQALLRRLLEQSCHLPVSAWSF